mgnify:CR=1 FL=1
MLNSKTNQDWHTLCFTASMPVLILILFILESADFLRFIITFTDLTDDNIVFYSIFQLYCNRVAHTMLQQTFPHG